MRNVVVSVALLLGSTTSVVSAHHSATMFDRERARTIEGTVKQFQWTNPHAWLQVDVTDGHEHVEWSVELNGINALARGGYRPGTFKPGDAITVFLAPHVDGVPAGLYIGSRLPDGTVLGRLE
jgi:hypothetical protein